MVVVGWWASRLSADVDPKREAPEFLRVPSLEIVVLRI
jgi:hypothetical protein